MAAVFVMKADFFVNALPEKTTKLLDLIQKAKSEFLNRFYLTGGTALSLLLGHRESEDLDWFNQSDFDPVSLQPKLEAIGSLTNAYINGVKVQFLGYPYPLLEPLISWQNIKISSLTDIACTKLQTIGMRGSKKDFIDLFFLLKQFSLEGLLCQCRRPANAADAPKDRLGRN